MVSPSLAVILSELSTHAQACSHTHSFTATALIKPFLLHGESEGAKLGAYCHFKILGRQQTDIWTNELIRSESYSGSD